MVIENELEDDDPLTLLFEKLDRILSRKMRDGPVSDGVRLATERFVRQVEDDIRVEDVFRRAVASAAAGYAYRHFARQAKRHGRRPPPPPPFNPFRAPDAALIRARDILGFSPNEPLTREQVQRRRRELARRYHPDRGGGAQANARMVAINEAADTLLQTLG